jgi:hypothetical protein
MVWSIRACIREKNRWWGKAVLIKSHESDVHFLLSGKAQSLAGANCHRELVNTIDPLWELALLAMKTPPIQANAAMPDSYNCSVYRTLQPIFAV